MAQNFQTAPCSMRDGWRASTVWATGGPLDNRSQSRACSEGRLKCWSRNGGLNRGYRAGERFGEAEERFAYGEAICHHDGPGIGGKGEGMWCPGMDEVQIDLLVRRTSRLSLTS